MSKHRYLTIDGELSGTGVRDTVNGGFLKLGEVGLSETLSQRIEAWVNRYAEAHYAGFRDAETRESLDREGITILRLARGELPAAKIRYVSAATVRVLVHEFEA